MLTTSVAQAAGGSNSELTNLLDVMYNLGDDGLSGRANYEGDHGLGRSRKAWFTTGQENTGLGSCNTYTVAASKVR